MARRGRVQRIKPGRIPGESSGTKVAPRAAAPAAAARTAGGSSSKDAIPNEWHKRSAELNPKYKSQLCKSFMEMGPDGCRFGDGCVFAHGEHELRVPQKDDVVVANTRRSRGSKSNKALGERKPRVQFHEDTELEQCHECSSRPVTPVCDEEPQPVPEWATADIDPVLSSDCTITTPPPLLARSDSVLAADSLFLDETIDTSTVADGPVVYGVEASPESQLRSRFSFATCATPRECPSEWNSSQVVSWVRSRGVPTEVAALFAEHEVDGNDLLSMTKTELREVGVTKMGHLMKLVKGISELNGTATAPVNNMVVADTLASEPNGNLKDMTRLTALTSSTVSAQAVGPSQLIAEAVDVMKRSDNVHGLNEVLRSAVMANKAAEVIRGEADDISMPLSLCMHAAKHGRVGCLERLLRELAAQDTVNAVRVDDGCTALHLAAYSGAAGCVRLLLQAGADASLVNRYGETAAECASKQGHGMISDLIAQTVGNIASLPRQNDLKWMMGRSSARQPRRHAKKSRDTLASELSAWRNGNLASAA